jgi:hypothetical protein
VTSRSSRKPKTRKELSKADLKAYEARRADERKRIGSAHAQAEPAPTPVVAQVEHTYAISRNDEFAVIRADLMRLLVILGVIAVIMVVLTIVLR